MDIAAAVNRAWALALAQRAPQPDRSWEDSDGDSIKAIHLFFEIEEILGAPVPMELLEPHFTANDLIRAIEKLLKAAPATTVPAEADTPTVFLCPAYDGDGPILVRFRSAFEDRLRFHVVRYPSWEELIASKGQFEIIVQAVVEQVLEHAEAKKDIALLGYSFGGLVAAEVGHRLAALGRRVTYLGIIDTRLGELAAARPRVANVFARVRATPNQATAILLGSAVRYLARHSAFGLLGLLGTVAKYLPSGARLLIHWALVEQLRMNSAETWKFPVMSVPVTLFRSGRSRGPADSLGWNQYCKNLEIVAIDGSNHNSILEKPYNVALCEHVIRHVRGPVTRAPEARLTA